MLQNLHVLLHAILSQRGIWTYITVWLCFSNVLIKLKDIFHLLRHKTKIIFSWLMQTTIFLFLLMQSRYIYVTFKIYVHSKHKIRYQWKYVSQVLQIKYASVAFSLKFCILNFKVVCWDGLVSQTTPYSIQDCREALHLPITQRLNEKIT